MFDKAIDMDPKNETARNSKADALSTMGRYEEAIRVYDQTIEINANDLIA
ncbi:MAG TPA: tetratricopeptide repeat protein [Clostridia bacterium]|nr:tetratricopeptide repeat protein [Clostridia bacterium]